MNQMIKYEMKKYVLRKYNIIILLILTVLFCVFLFFSQSKYFFDKSEYQIFYEQAGETFTENTKEMLERELNQLSEKVFVSDEQGNIIPNKLEIKKKGKYSVTKIGDYSLLRGALECIEVVEKRNSNMAIVTDASNSYQGNQISSVYTAEKNSNMVDRTKLNAFASCMYFGWPVCMLLIVIIGASFSTESEMNILGVLGVTRKGEWSLYVSKILTGVIVTIGVNLYFILIYLVTQRIFIGLNFGDLKEPLFLVEGYEMSASGSTLMTLLMKQELLVIILSLMVVFLTMMFSKWIGKSIYTIIGVTIMFLIGTSVDLMNLGVYQNDLINNTEDWYLASVTTFNKILEYTKMFNPFSTINMKYYLAQPRVFSISSMQYPLYFLPIILMIVLIGGCSIYIIQNKRRG